jgi:hypothetical protein
VEEGLLGDVVAVLVGTVSDVAGSSAMTMLVAVTGTDESVTSVGVEMASTHAAQRMTRVDA